MTLKECELQLILLGFEKRSLDYKYNNAEIAYANGDVDIHLFDETENDMPIEVYGSDFTMFGIQSYEGLFEWLDKDEEWK